MLFGGTGRQSESVFAMAHVDLSPGQVNTGPTGSKRGTKPWPPQDAGEQFKDFTRARFQAMDHLRHNRDLTPAARLVGWEILSRVNMTNQCAWPNQETLAADLGLTSRTVRAAIKQLVEAGEITVVRGSRGYVYHPTFVDCV